MRYFKPGRATFPKSQLPIPCPHNTQRSTCRRVRLVLCSCTVFPESFATDVGLPPGTVPDSANLTQTLAAGNLAGGAAVAIVDRYVRAVYASSAPGAAADPFACDANGLATLTGCAAGGSAPASLLPDGGPVRAATLAGALVPAPWATGGRALSPEGALAFYPEEDFAAMAALGANAVQLPVPSATFAEDWEEPENVAKTLIGRAAEAGLHAILVLADDEEEAADDVMEGRVFAAAKFAAATPNVVALQLPAPRAALLGAARAAAETLAVLVPTTRGELRELSFPPDSRVFAALDAGATTSVADVASSSSADDRMKMFYHESIACIDRSPIEWSACYRDTPVYVTSGFDLAVDDCIHKDEKAFKDYGQCDPERFEETVDSGWWARHRRSLAARQLFAYSKGLGWTYSAWKVDGGEEGALDDPARLLSLRDVAAAGLLPPLDGTNATALGAACLNGPVADFVLGDDTLAPTPGPPPDCGNGWWNATTEQCDYWVPPPEPPKPTDWPALCKGAGVGAILALGAGWGAKKIMGKSEGYQALP